MKKNCFFLALALLAAGCAQETEFAEPSTRRAETPEIQTRSLGDAVYHEATDSWIVPQKDPYTLANFQAAYDNLAAQKSVQSLAVAQVKEFASARRLEATHYALKIFPRNEQEQWHIEMMDDSYNQGANNNVGYPNDNIQNVQPSSIWNIIATSTTWAQCRSKIVSLAGTSTDFNDWIDDFDTWADTFPLTIQ